MATEEAWLAAMTFRFNLVDRLTLAYLGYVIALVLVCRGQVGRWHEIALIHLGLMAGIALLARFREGGPRWLQFLSHWYPVGLFGFLFEEIGQIVHAVYPGWQDRWLIAADYAMFGAHPTVWVEQFSSYWLTEYMQLVYTSYLFLIPAFGAYLWMRGRRDGFELYLVSMCVTYYLCYLIFVLFPIESPHHTLAHLQGVELTGGPFTAFINLIEKHGRVHGGAFPSTHVAGAWVVLISAFRSGRRAGLALLPLVLSISAATVYGRYHYVSDVIAGVGMACLGCWLGARLVRRERR
ncbi:MAG TPA: phosphatase PAP2 family protein [Blastocatellia bacterium]|jgi:membrane-associated phospholipid phosphatase|nr:phosphatase PAP2 family protein [Blastocatellia bacterium]